MFALPRKNFFLGTFGQLAKLITLILIMETFFAEFLSLPGPVFKTDLAVSVLPSWTIKIC